MNPWSQPEKKADFSSSSGSGKTQSSGYQSSSSKNEYAAEAASTRGNVGWDDEQSWHTWGVTATRSSTTPYSAPIREEKYPGGQESKGMEMTEEEMWQEMDEIDNDLEEMHNETRQDVYRLLSRVKELQQQREEDKRLHRQKIRDLKLRIRAETINAVVIETKYGCLLPDRVLKLVKSRFGALGLKEEDGWADLYRHPEFEHYQRIVEKVLHPEADGGVPPNWDVEGDAVQFATIIEAILSKGKPATRERGPPLTFLIPSEFTKAEKKVMRALCGFLPIACTYAAGEKDSDVSDDEGSSGSGDEKEQDEHE